MGGGGWREFSEFWEGEAGICTSHYLDFCQISASFKHYISGK